VSVTLTDNAREARRWSNLLGLAARTKPVVATTPSDAVHCENKWRLLRYRARREGVAHHTPVLLVPSLINRHYVLDLQPGKSFAEWLVAQGFDVFIIDWGTPGAEDRYLTFDEICDGYIGRAVRVASRLAGTEKVHLLGYCLGGTLTAIYTAVRPERVASLTALAAPVSFHDEGLLSVWTRTPTFDLGAMVAGFGNVPWQLMQGAFQMLRPTLNLSKAAHVLDRAWDDEFLDGFLALETWGNDNVSFPGEAYAKYVQGLYRDDGLMRGTFTLSGRPVRLSDIRCPVLAVTFEHDNIVPGPSAGALLERVSSTVKERVHLPGGHVGAVVSRKAAERLWPKMTAFWTAHEPAAALPSAPVVVSEPPAALEDPTTPAPVVAPPRAPAKKRRR
jgi:polyhydroxyalkanoate synthase